MSLLPLMKLRLATPSVLVDVGRLRDLSYVRDAGDHIAIGALTRHRDLETSDVLARECGVLRGGRRARSATTRCATAARSAVRSRTATRPPTFRPRCSRSTRRSSPRARAAQRTIAAADFFHGFLETALAPDELLTEIRVPKAGANGFAYQKFNRRAQDWAIVGVGRGAHERRDARRARQHGFHAVARDRGRGRRSRRARRRPTRPSTRPRAPSRPPTSTPRPSTASTSPACSCAARSKRV